MTVVDRTGRATDQKVTVTRRRLGSHPGPSLKSKPAVLPVLSPSGAEHTFRLLVAHAREIQTSRNREQAGVPSRSGRSPPYLKASFSSRPSRTPDDRHLLAEPLPEVGPLHRLGGVHPEQARIAGAAPSHLRPELIGRR